MNKKAFTLLELLVVVLIIGILSAVAVPMYKKATEKSKVSEALLVMDTVAKGQQDWYMLKDSYTTNFANLSTDLIDKDGNPAQDDNYETNTYSYSLKETGILSERNNKEYMLYLDYETKQIMCTPSEHYICKDFAGLTEQPCKNANLSWANTNSTCYSNDEARCKGLYDDSVWNGELCGYYNKENNVTINEAMICKADSGSRYKGGKCQNSIVNAGGVCYGNDYDTCNDSTINSGGTCDGRWSSCNNVLVNDGVCNANHYSCQNSTFNGGTCIGNGVYTCKESTFNNGSKCIGSGTYSCGGATFNTNSVCEGAYTACNNITIANGGICVSKGTISCGGVTVKDGGICYANVSSACGKNWASGESTYEGTGCCCGKYCPKDAPKCDSSKCDPKYMK